MVRISEEDVIQPEGRIDAWELYPVLALLPVQPPEIYSLSLPLSHHNFQPVCHKLHVKHLNKPNNAQEKYSNTFLSCRTQGTYFFVCRWKRDHVTRLRDHVTRLRDHVTRLRDHVWRHTYLRVNPHSFGHFRILFLPGLYA